MKNKDEDVHPRVKGHGCKCLSYFVWHNSQKRKKIILLQMK